MFLLHSNTQLPYMVIEAFHSHLTVMYLLILCFLEFLRIYSNCNVIRIECELRGVGVFFTPRLKLQRCKTQAYTGATL